MEPNKVILDTIMAVATHYMQKGIEITFEKAKEIIEGICEKTPSLRGQIDIDELAKQIHATARQVGRISYNEGTLARFLEIPISELSHISPENLDSRSLYDHVRLEGEFQEWLEQWGYEVELGPTLTGLRGIEYIPDVYGQLHTLHGEFEICINFVCDSPPDEDRVFALLGKIETYAEAKKSFSFGDIFSIVTPNRLTSGAVNAIGLQNEQENYSVFPLEGGDVYALENARSPRDRQSEFYDKVRLAEEETRRGRIKRMSKEKDENFE